MDKQLLKKFFFIYAVSFFTVLIVTAIAVQTGFYKYKDTMAHYWEDETYLARKQQDPNSNLFAFLRPKDTKVKADFVGDLGSNICNYGATVGNPIISGACFLNTIMPGIAAASNAAKLFDSCVNNVLGQGYCWETAMVEGVNNGLYGGPLSACREVMFEGKANDECKIENSLVHRLPNAENDFTISSLFGKTYGLVPGTYDLAVTASQEATYLSRLDLYYNDTLAQIPFVDSSKVRAAGELEYTVIKGVSFGEAFFKLWGMSRNLSYYLIVIPVVALGFAIMFKVQVSPQTQITLIKILPRLIIVMILITFSYPIAALMLQVSKPVVDAIIALFDSITSDIYSVGSAGTVFWEIFLAIGLGLLGGLTWGIGWLVLGAVIGIVLLVVLFRWLMAVISTTLKLGFLISFGPLILLISVFPGREGIMKQYFINLVAAILGVMAIPVMISMSFLVWGIGFEIGKDAANIFIQLIVWITALGIIWKAYDAPKIISQALGAKSLLAETGFSGGGGGPRR